jgi:hypothetical protein
MFQLSVAENNLLQQNAFCYDKNDSAAVEIDLSLMP